MSVQCASNYNIHHYITLILKNLKLAKQCALSGPKTLMLLQMKIEFLAVYLHQVYWTIWYYVLSYSFVYFCGPYRSGMVPVTWLSHWLFCFQNVYIPLTLRTAEGSLTAVEPIVFEQTYPGKVPYKDLKIFSSFDNYMEVQKVTFKPNDTRFFYLPPRKPPVTNHLHEKPPVLLHPRTEVTIGRIFFDAKRECKEDCYLGLPTCIPGNFSLIFIFYLFFEPTCANARWAHMHHFPSVCLSVCP